jgi:hypothetical protein
VSLGNTFCAFFDVRDGFKLKEMMRKRVTRRRREMRIALGWPNLLRIIQYWNRVKVSPRNRRTRITQKGKIGDRVI